MEALNSVFSIVTFSEFELGALIKMTLAAACGGAIGLEREIKRRPAGLKTFSLVCLGSALVMVTNDFICRFITGGSGDMARMAAQVVSGIGFLGAGTIMATGYDRIKGLTTAAALWVTAALGLAIGSGFYFGAMTALCMIYFISFIYNYIDRKIMEHSRNMMIYVDGKDEEFMLRLIAYFDSHQIRIVNLVRKSENKWYVNDVCAMIAIKFTDGISHGDTLEDIRRIEGIRYVEEL